MRPAAGALPLLVQICALAAAYGVAGKLGLLVAIPPGYATALWLPSGIALAALLTFGDRLWPGVLLGSLLVNASTAFDPSSGASLTKSIALGTGIGAGASLQAVIGTWLLRRYVGRPFELIRAWDVARFTFLGGPLSCVVNATLSVSLLALAGVVAWSEYAFTWWTWWAGDTIGVLVMTPVVLAWIGQPRVVWARRRLWLTAPMAVMLALIVSLFIRVSGLEQARIALEFQSRATTVTAAVTKQFDDAMEVVHSVGSLFSTVPEVDRAAFRRFVARSLDRHRSIQALSWNPWVPGAARQTFEAEARREGFPEFRIRERDGQGQLAVSGPRDEYVVVRYIEPLQGNEAAVGYDVASDPVRRDALARARRTGAPAATARIRLVQERGTQWGVLVFLPVFGDDRSSGPSAASVRGFATGVFRLGDMMDAALGGQSWAGLDIRVLDQGASPDADRLLWAVSNEAATPGPLGSTLRFEAPVPAADRRWTIIVRSSPEYDALVRSWRPWTVLAGGLLFTGVLGAFLLVVTGQTVLIERFGAQRAAELSQANAVLEQEIAERKQARHEAEQLALLAQTLTQNVEPMALSQRVVEQVPRVFDVGYCVVRLRRADGGLVALAVSGPQRGPFKPGHVLPAGVGLAARAVTEGRPLWTAHVLAESDVTHPDAVRQAIEAAGIRAMLIVPLRAKHEIIGVLSLGDARSRAFTAREVDLLQAFGDQLALALENARHVEELDRRRRTAERLAAVAQLVSQSLEPKDVARRIVEGLRELLHVQMVGLYRVVPGTGELVSLSILEGARPLFGEVAILPAGTGVAGRAVRLRQPVVTADLLSDPQITLPDTLRELIRHGPYRAVLAVPLLAHDEVIGALAVGDQLGRAFGEEDVQLVQAFADHAATALDNARLHETALRRAQQLATVSDVSRAFTRLVDPETAVREVLAAVQRLIPDAASQLWRYDERDGLLRPVASLGLREPAQPVSQLRDGEGMAGRAAHTRQPVSVPDVQADPHFVNKQWAAQEGVMSAVAVPLRYGDRLYGVLTIGTRTRREFPVEETGLLSSFADQAAIALENARLYTEATARRREAEALAEVAQTLTASLDVAAVAQRIVERVLGLFAVASAGFRLLQSDGTLRAVAADPSGAHAAPGDVLAPGMGISGRVVAEDRALWCRDMLTDPAFRVDEAIRHRLGSTGLSAFLGVPIRVKGQVIGALTIADKTGREFTAAEATLLQAFADQAALALENARHYEEIDRRREEAEAAAALARARQVRLEALVAVAREVSRLQPMEPLLARIAEACGRLLDSDSVGFRVVEGDDLVVAGTFGDAQEAMPARRLKIGESLSGHVAASGEPLLVPNPLEDPRLIPGHREALIKLGHRAWLGVPVKAGDRVLGVLSARTRRPEGFSAEDLAIATAFAAHAATGLENARLYQEIQEASKTLAQTRDHLTQAQKMEAVGRLAGGVAHDFNNMLTVILGRAQVLGKLAELSDAARRSLILIQQAAERAATITQQLLAFSRKQVLQPKVLSLNDTVVGLEKMLRRLIGEDIELVTLRAPDLGLVQADPGQLEQVLMNLVVNARDAMPQGGRLTIETRNVLLDEAFVQRHPGSRPGAHVRLSVVDTGIGMDAETQAQIFEPFFTTKPAGQGTGLGLAMVYGIVKQSNGYIGVESAPGRGTRFDVYLARVDDAIAEAQRTMAMAEIPRGTETVLLAEDDDDLRDLMGEALVGQGYTLLPARSGSHALETEAQHAGPIHLLVTDLVMPRMSGRELAERLRARRPALRVLYISGYTDDAILRHGVLAAEVALLPKPFTPDDLARRVRAVLDK